MQTYARPRRLKKTLPLSAWLCAAAILLLASGPCLALDHASDKYEIIKDEAHLPILTPAFAERQTLKLRLQNGLQVISYPIRMSSILGRPVCQNRQLGRPSRIPRHGPFPRTHAIFGH